METKRKRFTLRKRVIAAAVVAGAAFAAIKPASASALTNETLWENYQEVSKESVIDISYEEYGHLMMMVMAESGHCSSDMMNGCASAAVNQCIQNECTMDETLYRPGAFCFKFRDSKGVWRLVEISDVNEDVLEAVNDAIKGDDVTDGAIGFFAPNYCSKSTRDYMYRHTDDYYQVENVVFFKKWVN